MKPCQPTLPRDFYAQHLSIIGNIHFTAREIDVIACHLNGRKTKTIASFLSIDPRTVETHIRNITLKLDCNTRERIIDFVEESGKTSFFRRHCALLRINGLFERSLQEISKLSRDKKLHYVLIEEKEKNSLFINIKSHLNLTGIEISSALRQKEGDYILCILPNTLAMDETSIFLQKINKGSRKAIILLQNGKFSQELLTELARFDVINLEKEENYYFFFFHVLKRLLKHPSLDKIVTEFKNQYEAIWLEIESPQTLLSENIEKNKNENPTENFTVHKVKNKFILVLLLVIGILSGGGLAFYWNQKIEQPAFRSDLRLPKGPLLLNRPELIKEIDEKLKKQTGIQTVALIGIGGAGKTTTARLYVAQHKVACLWEFDAETQGGIKSSFEKLAKKLARTDEDQKILKRIQTVTNDAEALEGLVQFVKERLRSKNRWLLIYDNVENFIDIQKYFPYDAETWGNGRVVLTTRNGNIENNKYIGEVITIGELSIAQRLNIFKKILKDKYANLLKDSKDEKEINKFLEHIPPYPLDVSIAAYYLKTTREPLQSYLDKFCKNDTSFADLQKSILQDNSDYTRTRYNLIATSIQSIINSNEHFKDLLLLISLIDSQNIPKKLLNYFKDDVIANDFILNLKKYSILNNQDSNEHLTIHRSIQSNCLSYLAKKLNLEQDKELIKKASRTLADYLNKIIKDEHISQMTEIISNGEAFLDHQPLVTDEMAREVNGELGVMYYFTGNDTKAKICLEKSLENFQDYNAIDSERIAFFLGYLGNVYRDLGEYQQGKSYLEKSLMIYKKHCPEATRDYTYFLVYTSIIERYLGNYKEAKKLLETAIENHQQHLTNNKTTFAWINGQLGIIERIMGNYEESKKLLERSLLFFRNEKAPKHDISWALSHLAAVYVQLEEYQKARDALNECLKIYTFDFPDDIGPTWIAKCVKLQDDDKSYQQVQDIFKKILEKYKVHILGQYIYVVWPLKTLATLYEKLGNYRQAKVLLEQILQIYQINYGDSHIETGLVLKDLGAIYLQSNDLIKAEDLAQKSLTILKNSKHPEKYACLELLSEIYVKKSTIAAQENDLSNTKIYKNQSISYLNQALETTKTSYPEESMHAKRIRKKIEKINTN
jgi:DNA-binding CsgD family transcriptional regulator